MIYLQDIVQFTERIFKAEIALIAERISIVQLNFNEIELNLIEYSKIMDIFEFVPKRDWITITISSGAEALFVVNRDTHEKEYSDFFDAAKEDSVDIEIKIDKKTENNKFSIYKFEVFMDDLISLKLEDVFLAFAILFRDNPKLWFQIMDTNFDLQTTTMRFSSDQVQTNSVVFSRNERLEECQHASDFRELDKLNLLPDDFHVVSYDNQDKRLYELFSQMETILSGALIVTHSRLEQNKLHLRINGYRTDYGQAYLNDIKTNINVYKIYNWIYTDGNAIDKSLIFQNLVSINYKSIDIFNLDTQIFASLRSNYNIYLKQNVMQYLELKKSVSEFICDTVSKTGEFANALLNKFKGNLFAGFGFLLTTFITNAASEQPLENIFTNDITKITEVVLIVSVFYFIACIADVKYQYKKILNSYALLKNNYNDLFSTAELDIVFNDNEIIEPLKINIKSGIFRWSVVWGITLLICVLAIEFGSPYSLLNLCK